MINPQGLEVLLLFTDVFFIKALSFSYLFINDIYKLLLELVPGICHVTARFSRSPNGGPVTAHILWDSATLAIRCNQNAIVAGFGSRQAQSPLEMRLAFAFRIFRCSKLY